MTIELPIKLKQRMAKGKFVIVGRAGMDLYPKPANKQTSEAGTFISDLGGSAANIAVSISKLGGRSKIITVVSDDEIGDFVWKKLEEHKVDTSLVTKSQNNNARTSLAIAEIREEPKVVIYRNNAADLLIDKQNIDSLAYDKFINKENTHKDNPQVSIFTEIKNFEKYLKPFINNFEQSFFEDFNQNTNQNILILNSKKDWLFTFEKNTENQFDLSALKKLKDFNKYTLKQNEDIYSIYSKDILEEKDNVIKQLTYENIYSIESGGLQIISNHLIDGKKLEKISKKFFNLKSNKDKSAFLYSKVDIKDGNSNKIEYFSNLQDLNFLIKNILKISNEESLEIISQSIPEKNPIIYRETILNIL